MSNTLRLCSSLAFGTICALALNSCTDPYYYSVGGAYGTGYDGGYYGGYGSGYGYGNPSFSTSFFVSTGDSRWGYDPYCYSYYDYNRRCYYDPYLYGYYPMGYRPLAVVGVPHPHGYRSNYCPPPSRVTNVHLANYNNRATAYRSTGHSWASGVRQQSYTPPRGGSGPRYQAQPGGLTNPAGSRGGSSNFRSGSSNFRSGPPQLQNPNPYSPPPASSGGFQPGGGRNSGNFNSRPPQVERSSGLPRSYNVPVEAGASRQRSQDMRERRAQFTPPQAQPQPRPTPMPTPPAQNIRPQPVPPAEREAPSASNPQTVRGLGEAREAGGRRR